MTNALDETCERPEPAVGVSGGPQYDRVATRAAGSAAVAAVVLLVGLGAGLLGQGGYVGWLRWPVGLLVLAAAALAVRGRHAALDALRCPPVPAAGMLAVWVITAGALHGSVGAGAAAAALLTGFCAVLVTCRQLPASNRQTVLDGLMGFGLLLAATGWLGVALHHRPWGLVAQDLWRASSTLTYPNATAAVLAPLALIAIAELSRRRSLALTLAATGLLTGIGATGSRAGVLVLALGLLVLGAVLGVRPVTLAVLAPGIGAAVALAGLLPSVPASSPARPGWAGLALLLGLALAAAIARMTRRAAAGTAGLLAAVTATVVLGGPASLTAAAQAVTGSRVTLASSDRVEANRAAVRLISTSPLTGSGPGQAHLQWTDLDVAERVIRYAHNEYLQLTAELGLIGAALLAVLLATIARLLLTTRRRNPTPQTWAGVAAALTALSAHSALDFLWHIPAIPLTAAALIGLAAPIRPPAGSVVPAPTHSPEEET
jgi:hypothetical protein